MYFFFEYQIKSGRTKVFAQNIIHSRPNIQIPPMQVADLHSPIMAKNGGHRF
jgi:hypothetical protein